MFNFLRKLLSPIKPPAQIEPLPPMPTNREARLIVETYQEMKRDIEHRYQYLMREALRDKLEAIEDNRIQALKRLTELGLSSDEIAKLLSGEGE